MYRKNGLNANGDRESIKVEERERERKITSNMNGIYRCLILKII